MLAFCGENKIRTGYGTNRIQWKNTFFVVGNLISTVHVDNRTDEQKKNKRHFNRKKTWNMEHVCWTNKSNKFQHQMQIEIESSVLYRISFLDFCAKKKKIILLNRWIPECFCLCVGFEGIATVSAADATCTFNLIYRVNLLYIYMVKYAKWEFCEARNFQFKCDWVRDWIQLNAY